MKGVKEKHACRSDFKGLNLSITYPAAKRIAFTRLCIERIWGFEKVSDTCTQIPEQNLIQLFLVLTFVLLNCVFYGKCYVIIHWLFAIRVLRPLAFFCFEKPVGTFTFSSRIHFHDVPCLFFIPFSCKPGIDKCFVNSAIWNTTFSNPHSFLGD
jgi:hypothetical protein